VKSSHDQFKRGDDVLDGFDQLAPDLDDRGVVGAKSGFAKDNYERGFLHVHLIWGGTEGEWNGKALCARYEWLFDDPNGSVGLETLGHEPWIDNEDGAVFVDVVESAEHPQPFGVGRRWVPLVGLRVDDRCELIGRKEGLKMLDALRFLKPVLVHVDGKVDLAEHLRIARLRFHNGVDDVIEARPQLVNGITKGESALDRWCKDLGWPGVPLSLKLVVDNGRSTSVHCGDPTKGNVLEVTEVFSAHWTFLLAPSSDVLICVD
jgi:hypothetical protein